MFRSAPSKSSGRARVLEALPPGTALLAAALITLIGMALFAALSLALPAPALAESDTQPPNGTVTWGGNSYGQLGNAPAGTSSSYAYTPPGLSDATHVDAGGYHNLAVKPDGSVKAWGRNDHGQVGYGTTDGPLMIVDVPGLTNVAKVSGGNQHSLALKEDGTVWAWGDDTFGQVGDGGAPIDGSPRFVTTPQQVPGLSGVKGISAGGFGSIVVKNDGTVWAWGSNDTGMVGDGTRENRTSPVQVMASSGVPLTDVKSVSAGSMHNIALKNDGTVWVWGWNSSGQIGNGTQGFENNRSYPTKVEELSGITSVVAGSEHNLALRSDGLVWGWGENDRGQVGVGGGGDQLTPVIVQRQNGGSVTTLNDVKTLSAGLITSFAVTSGDEFYSWGNSASKILGHNHNPTNIAQRVHAFTGMEMVSGGLIHTIAIKNDTVNPETSVNGPNSGWSRSANLTFSLSSNEGSVVFECRLDDGNFYACGGSPTFDNLAEGEHTIIFRSVDGAGNVDDSPTTRTIRVDTVSPETVLDEAPDALSNVETARFRFSAQDANADAGVGYMCRLDEGDYETCSDPKEYAGIAEGEYVFEVYALDAAGNADETPETHGFTVDRTPPPVPEITFPDDDGFSSRDGHVRMGGSAAPGSKVEVFEDGMWDAPLDADIADGDGEWSMDVAGLSEGEHRLTAVASDGAKNYSPRSAPLTVTVDTVAPETSIDSAPSGFSSGSATFSFGSTDGDVVYYQCSLDGAAFSTCSSPLTLPGLADGAHGFEVRSVDAAGHRDPSPASTTWTVDTVAPSGTVKINNDAARARKLAVTLSLSATDPAPASEVEKMRFSNDGRRWSAWQDYGVTKKWSLKRGKAGTRTVFVQFSDKAGNVSVSARDTIKYKP